MVRSLWTAASGMIGQQSSIDTISNNLANVNTPGFKKMRADFEDLIYQTTQVAGTPATEDTVVPVPIQMGHGVKLAATQREFLQGALQNTENISDIAIQGDGFFRVMTYDGSYAYSRDGAFKIDSNGQFVTSDGYKLMPELTLPQGYIPETLSISQDGRVFGEVHLHKISDLTCRNGPMLPDHKRSLVTKSFLIEDESKYYEVCAQVVMDYVRRGYEITYLKLV